MGSYLLCSVSAVFILVLSNSGVVDSQERELCSKCMYLPWRKATTSFYTQTCQMVNMDMVKMCLDVCDEQGGNMPDTYKIRQLTQVSDIMHHLNMADCDAGPESCKKMLTCMDDIANYGAEGPYQTVTDYDCSPERLAEAEDCFAESAGCMSQENIDKLREMLSLGIDKSCNDPKRCLSYGNIYETVPGTGCTQIYQEPMPFGPAVRQPIVMVPGLGFDTSICRSEYLRNLNCADGPRVQPTPIAGPTGRDVEMSETTVVIAPPEVDVTTRAPAQVTPVVEVTMRTGEPPVLPPIDSGDTTQPCHICIDPIWQNAVMKNGSSICNSNIEQLLTTCLSACVNIPIDLEQNRIETVVKLVDIIKSLSLNGCPTIATCQLPGASDCVERFVNFSPATAPYVTVNSFNCGLSQLDLFAAITCLAGQCNVDFTNLPFGNILTGVLADVYNSLCNDPTRCMINGKIFDLVPASEGANGAVPCGSYREGKATGWTQSEIIEAGPGMVFNANTCQLDTVANYECPSEIVEG